ncbi:MAG: sugar kinase [Planctomycetales bacterium]|nr:sugar kinase [Planctomycetales bacterium]
MAYDVVTLGETMLRLTPPEFQRLEQTGQLEVFVGGSESNTAVGLSRLGHPVAWISRLTQNPLGKRIANELTAQNVDTSHIVWTPNDRVGTYFMERGRPPRATTVYYDRSDSAMARITPADLPIELFRAGNSRLFHTTGITMGLSRTAGETAIQAAQLANASGWEVSFDLNYRSKLWSLETAWRSCAPILELAKLIFLPSRDAQAIALLHSKNLALHQIEELLAVVSDEYPSAIVVLTRGADGAACRTPNGEVFLQSAFPAIEVERLGGGDAFSAGFLAGYLQGSGIPRALQMGAAVAALKYTLPGDLPLIEKDWVEQIISGDTIKLNR